MRERLLKDTKKRILNAYDLVANLKGLSINTGEKKIERILGNL
ncbi:uncharacterized protein METZ01_LOCUS195579 [marine metagenome]|uniref:Uncharacterized protein n=1 Tax=marine metagenome TaxID=408172 RepID=A0A382DWU8_9ZZZZ